MPFLKLTLIGRTPWSAADALVGLLVALPDQPQPGLNPARRIGLGADRPEGQVRRSSIRDAERYAIRNVKRLEADLNVLPLGEVEALAHGHVQLFDWIPAQVVELIVERLDITGKLLRR